MNYYFLKIKKFKDTEIFYSNFDLYVSLFKKTYTRQLLFTIKSSSSFETK